MPQNVISAENERILDEIKQLEDKKVKSGIAVEVVDVIFSPVTNLIKMAVNKKVVEKNVGKIKKILEQLQNTSRKFVNKKAIIKRASNAGLPVKTIKDFRQIPVSYLDVLAKRYLKKNSQFAALQGAGLGVGSYALTLIDIPALFLVNMRMILKIGACYGYEPDTIEEREFALHIFYIASSTGKKKEERIQKIIDLMDSFSKGTFDRQLSILATEEGIKGFIDSGIFKFVKKMLTRSIPVVGVALGYHFNYLYTKEVATYAHIFYRKRFIKDFG